MMMAIDANVVGEKSSTSNDLDKNPTTPQLPGYCGLVQACDEDENWGQVLRDQQQQKEGEDDIDFSPGAIAALRARLEALRCSAVAAAVAPARAVGRKNGDEEEEDKEARVASSDAAYAAAIDRVKAGDMPGAAAKLRDALFVEGRPRARERIEKYLRACEARIFLKKG